MLGFTPALGIVKETRHWPCMEHQSQSQSEHQPLCSPGSQACVYSLPSLAFAFLAEEERETNA